MPNHVSVKESCKVIPKCVRDIMGSKKDRRIDMLIYRGRKVGNTTRSSTKTSSSNPWGRMSAARKSSFWTRWPPTLVDWKIARSHAPDIASTWPIPIHHGGTSEQYPKESPQGACCSVLEYHSRWPEATVKLLEVCRCTTINCFPRTADKAHTVLLLSSIPLSSALLDPQKKKLHQQQRQSHLPGHHEDDPLALWSSRHSVPSHIVDSSNMLMAGIVVIMCRRCCPFPVSPSWLPRTGWSYASQKFWKQRKVEWLSTRLCMHRAAPVSLILPSV